MATKPTNKELPVKGTEQTAEPAIVEPKNESKETIVNAPNLTPELVDNILSANFEHIRKYYGIGAYNKAKTPENKHKLLQRFKRLVDSMEYLSGWL